MAGVDDDEAPPVERRYQLPVATVLWRPALCEHCGHCTDALPAVFNVAKRPWVNVKGAPAEKIAEVVAGCPSRALSMEYPVIAGAPGPGTYKAGLGVFVDETLGARVVHCKTGTAHVYVGRPSKWGNPFVIGRDGTREEVVAKFEAYLRRSPKLMSQLHELRGLVLGCWCQEGDPCHAQVLLRLANGPEGERAS